MCIHTKIMRFVSFMHIRLGTSVAGMLSSLVLVAIMSARCQQYCAAECVLLWVLEFSFSVYN